MAEEIMNRIISRIFLISALFPACQLYANDALLNNKPPNNESLCKEVKFQPAANAWIGHYYLQGVMEVGSELLLEPDGKFKWYLAVGALDQYAEGTWWKNGTCIGLKAAPQYRQYLEIFPTRLDLSESGLNATWPDGHQKGQYVLASH